MRNSRTKNSVLIMVTSGLRQGCTLFTTFLSRTVFIYVLGAEYLGLNGLFSNILSILALSELGIGTAISFYLYKPLAEGDTERIKALMQFYKVCYRVVGLTMIVLGCCIMPLLPIMVNFNQPIPINLYLVYFIYLLNTAFSYLFFAYKQALVMANQEQYKIEKINIIFTFLNCAVDILILLLFKNYILYLIGKLILVLLKNLFVAAKIDKEYPYLKERNTISVSKSEIVAFFKDIGAVSLFRIGSTLFNATDNIIISMLLGTIVVGYYSNYYMIISQVVIFLQLIVKSFTAGIGNLIVKENRTKQYELFKQIDFAVYFLSAFCTICLFQLLNSFIKIWIGGVGSEYVLSPTVVAFLCMSFYFDNTTQILNAFREGSGNFSIGKSLQVIAGVVNIILSVVFARIWGLEGVFLATVVSKAFITVLPFVANVGRVVFGVSVRNMWKNYLSHIFVTAVVAGAVGVICIPVHMTNIGGFVLECFLTVSVSIVGLFIFYRKTDEMKALMDKMKILIIRRTNI